MVEIGDKREQRVFFSIIIPVYNTERYLPICLKSVLEQTYRNYEVILINDGSTDGSLEVCRKFEDENEQILVLDQENTGQAVARNHALKHAKGDYIIFVDSDDWVETTLLQDVASIINQYGAQMVVYGETMVFENGKRKKIHNKESFEVYDTKQAIEEWLTGRGIGTILCNKAYKKTLFDTIQFPPVRSGEDAYVMPYLIGACNQVVSTSKTEYYYRIRPGSTEQKPYTQERIERILNKNRKHLQYIEENFAEQYPKMLINAMRSKMNILMNISVSLKQWEHREIRQRVEIELREEWKGYKNTGYLGDERIVEVEKFLKRYQLKCVIWTVIGVKKKIEGFIKCVCSREFGR